MRWLEALSKQQQQQNMPSSLIGKNHFCCFYKFNTISKRAGKSFYQLRNFDLKLSKRRNVQEEPKYLEQEETKERT